MTDSNDERGSLTGHDRDRYLKLNAMDAKSAAVLQLSGIFIVLIYMQAFRDAARWRFLLSFSTIVLLVSILLHFGVLWFSEKPMNDLVTARKALFNLAVGLAFLAVLATLLSYAAGLAFGAASGG